MISQYITVDELNKFNCKKYKYKSENNELIFSCEKNSSGEWIDTTEMEKLKLQIEQEMKQLNKMTDKEI